MQSITGITVRETVPDWVLKRVDEVVMSDLTPEALQNRMRRGDIYPLDRVGPCAGEFLSSGKSDRVARAGAAAGGAGSGSQPGILS